MDFVIETLGLSKSFGKNKAVDRLDLRVPRGTIFALLGPNGAGKTTTVRLLNGILRPTQGRIFVFGENVLAKGDIIRSRCGVQTDTNLYEKLTAYDNLAIWGQFFGLAGKVLSRRIDELLGMFGLKDRKNSLVSSLSKGMKQKLAIARAIIHKPEILFLDEPTAGLDPEATEDVLMYLNRYVQESDHTVFLCSHRLEEVERLSRVVTILHDGTVLASGSIPDLVSEIWEDSWIRVEMVHNHAAALKALAKAGYSCEVHEENKSLLVKVKKRSEIPDIVELLVKERCRILAVEEQTHSLKDVYLNLVPQEIDEHHTS